jgi:transglutaminase-like putative cysteine protease
VNIFPKTRAVTSGDYLPHAEFPWLLAVVLVTVLPHFPYLPYGLIAIIVGILLYFFLRWQRGYRATSAWIKVPIAIFVGLAIVLNYRLLYFQNAGVQETGVAVLSFCMTIKLLELKGRRDIMVIVALGYFLLLTHYFYTQEFLAGIWLFASALVVTAALLHLHDDPERPVRQTLKQASYLLLQAIPLALILYLLFPRLDGPLWAIPRGQSNQTGLAGYMRPGHITQLAQSDEVAFRAQFSGAIPPRRQLYWRGPVLSQYDGVNWIANDYALYTPPIETSGTPVPYTLILEPHYRSWLLPLEMPTSFTGIPGIHFNRNGVLLSARPISTRTRLEFISYPEYRMEVGTLNSFQRNSNLQLPDDRNPRSQRLAEQFRAENPMPEQMAARILRFFREEPFYYTLNPPLLGAHAVDDFLFSSRQGFCEHYASAFVVMMRAAGIPARVVTGYLGGELNPVDQVLTVRQSTAHAWAEIWTAENGWLRYDPTSVIPPERTSLEILDQQNENSPEFINIALTGLSLLQRAQYQWDALNNRWNYWVLGYTAERQREYFSRFGLVNPGWKKIALFFAGISFLSLGLLAWLILRKRVKSLEPAWAIWLSACEKLNRSGIETPQWETPLALVQRLKTTWPERAKLNATLRHLARLVYAVRYENARVPIRLLKKARARLEPYA